VKDLLGKVILDKITVNGEFELDLFSWEKGVYLIELDTKDGLVVIRILKE
jgi:hypothetical protein